MTKPTAEQLAAALASELERRQLVKAPAVDWHIEDRTDESLADALLDFAELSGGNPPCQRVMHEAARRLRTLAADA